VTQVSHRQSALAPSRQPFLYLCAALVSGIVLERRFEPEGVIVTTTAIAIALASIAFFVAKRQLACTLSLIVGIGFAGALLSFAARTRDTGPTLQTLFAEKVITPDDPVELTGILAAPPEPAPESLYLDLAAEQIRIQEKIIVVSGRARLMLTISGLVSRDELSKLALDYGSRIRVLVRLERARSFSNPGSPDFNEFLERRGFDLKGAIKSPLLIERLDAAPVNRILYVLYHLRLRMIEGIDRRFKPPVSGTLKAMLAGNRYFLDHRSVELLRESSTFHTLVIAGLHVGIIAWVLLGGRSTAKRRKLWRVTVSLSALWAYAVMVGLAPPVTRATTMISVGLIGPILFRRSSSINTVSLAAFLMLALKPALVADPGFQMSFIAVAGIAGLALPLNERLREIGEWRPTSHTPHPPVCAPMVRYLAESLYWDQPAFDREMKHAPIRFKLKKASASRWLGRLHIEPILRGAFQLIITSTAIQFATLPLMALYFNRVAPVGVLLNVIAGLLTAVVMLSAIGSLAVSGISVWIASRLEAVVSGAHFVLVNAVVPFVEFPFATFRVAHYEGKGAIVYVLYFVPFVMLARRLDLWQPVDYISALVRESHLPLVKDRSRRKLRDRHPALWPMMLVLLLAAAVLMAINPPIEGQHRRLTVHFLDVGQGDSALIIFPQGKTMLVDGGGELRFGKSGGGENRIDRVDESEPMFPESAFSIGEAVVSRFIWSLGRTRIDYVLATHSHADHIGGLSDVVRNIWVGQAIVGHAPSVDPEYDRFVDTLRRRRRLLTSVNAGERFEIDDVSIEVLWPPQASGTPVTSGNDDSVVLRLIYGSTSILLAGDIEQRAEEALVESGTDLRSDVLKVPHHGSKTSSTQPFLEAVSPRYAVISVGERSRFGHPHKSVVTRYQELGVKLFQTGRDGMVTINTDGSTLDIRTYRSERAKIED
jgi:competence protein ComEC